MELSMGWIRGFHRNLGSACLLAGLVLGACADDKDADSDEHGGHDHDADVGPATGATCPDGSTLTYDNFGKEFMTKYCTTCHGEQVTGANRMMAPADHNFDTLAEIDLLKKHIDEMAGSGPSATNRTMPKADPKPTDDERKKLSEWLACGPK
jgi:uncharacterized membrane protein